MADPINFNPVLPPEAHKQLAAACHAGESTMEKRNVVEDGRTPEFGKQAGQDSTEDVAVGMFKDKPVVAVGNLEGIKKARIDLNEPKKT